MTWKIFKPVQAVTLAVGILTWIPMAAQFNLPKEQPIATGGNDSTIIKLGQLRNMRKETEAKLTQCTHELRLKKQTIAKNDQQLLWIALKCLIEPYNENMINWVGITAFDAIQNPAMKKNYEVLPIIMGNQTRYVEQLHKFFREYGGKPVVAGAANNDADNEANGVTANDICRAFENLPVYQNYIKLGPGWEKTCLGKFLFETHQALKGLTPITAKDVFSGLSIKLNALNIK